MKLKLNLHNVLAAELGDVARIPATVHLDALFDSTALPEECDLDLDQILQENRLIAHIWTIADVRETRPDLTDDQAWEVLKSCFRDLDSRDGISWDTIDTAAETLFGAPCDRSRRFAEIVSSYTDDDPATNLVDLLTDSLHWCRQQALDFGQALTMSRAHFAAETNDGDGSSATAAINNPKKGE